MWQYHPVLLIFQIGVLISLGVAAYCLSHLWRRGWSTVVTSVGLLAFFNAIWNGAATLKVASTALEAKMVFYKLEFLGSAVNPSVAVALALAYLGYNRWLSRKIIALLVAIPVVVNVLIWANPGGEMIGGSRLVADGGVVALEHAFQPLFLTYLAWALGATLFSGSLLAVNAFSSAESWRPSALLSLALLLPVGTVMVKVFGVYPPGGEGINVTPAVNTGSLAMVALAIGRYRLFELLPVGRTQALEAVEDGYVLTDAEGAVIDANSAARTLLGETTLVGRAAAAVLPRYEGLCDAEKPLSFTEDSRTLEIQSSPLTDGAQLAGRVLVISDVTAQREKKRQLERENQRLDQFASVLSHDLRNPLNVAHGRLDLAQEEGECADPGEHLASVERSLHRMDDIIEDVLALTWGGRTVEDDARSTCALAEVAEAAWNGVETGEATLQLENTPTIDCHEGRLQRLFENLFRNAVEHGSAPVTVTVGGLADGFFVEDNGVGIPQDERDTVMEGGYSSKEEGTGLGLTIVAAAAEAHGWTVEIADGRSGGARFEIRG